MRDRVQKVIDRLRPAFDTTEVTLLGVKDGIVRVEVFAPGCHGGPPKEATVAILEEQLREEIPEIRGVVADEAPKNDGGILRGSTVARSLS